MYKSISKTVYEFTGIFSPKRGEGVIIYRQNLNLLVKIQFHYNDAYDVHVPIDQQFRGKLT